jgi:hypothetical protein
LPREHEVNACCEKLLGSNAGIVAITAPQKRKATLAVHGMGGAGKSVLANAVARDERIRRHFTEGIFWVSIGQDNAGTEAKAVAMQSSLASRLGKPLSVTTSHEGRQHLRRLLADRCCLIILDDVWETIDAQRLDVVEEQSASRILMTTREGRVVTDLDADEVAIGKLSPEQAVELLSEWCGKSVRDEAEALTVARQCGYLPLALAVCGAMARDRVSWADIASGLRHADLSFLRRSGLDPVYESVLKSIAASVDHLRRTEPRLGQRYVDLAVFPADETVPESVVARLWARTSGCPPYQAGIDLSTLERKSLLSLEGVTPHRRVSLHDLQHDYVKGTHTDLAGANAQLVEAYRPAFGGWAGVADDGYVLQHLAYHLSEAKLRDELHGLLLDFDWLEAELRATDLAQLLVDFGRLAGDETLNLVRDAVRLSGHHLMKVPALLHSQLHGRLLGVDSPVIKGLLQKPSGRAPRLRCLSPSLAGPGGRLIMSLERHAGDVTAVAVTCDGTRAVSASNDDTLKVWDLTSGKLLNTFATDHPLHCCDISSTGETIVAADQRGRVHFLRYEGTGLGP